MAHVTHLGPDLGELLLKHVLHLPVRGDARDAEQEAPQRGAPPLAVLHLRVVLQPIHPVRCVLHRDHCALNMAGVYVGITYDSGVSQVLPTRRFGTLHGTTSTADA